MVTFVVILIVVGMVALGTGIVSLNVGIWSKKISVITIVVAILCLVAAVCIGPSLGSGSSSGGSNYSSSSSKCAFTKDGKEVCDSSAVSGSPFCSYHKKIVDGWQDTIDDLEDRYESLQ